MSRRILGSREVQLPARAESVEAIVAEIRQAAGGVYMLGLGLDALKEEAGAGGAIALAKLIERRCDALQRLCEQRDGEGRADG